MAACNPDHPELRYPDVFLQFMKDERSSWFVLNLLVVGTSTDLHDWMIEMQHSEISTLSNLKSRSSVRKYNWTAKAFTMPRPSSPLSERSGNILRDQHPVRIELETPPGSHLVPWRALRCRTTRELVNQIIWEDLQDGNRSLNCASTKTSNCTAR